MSYQEACLLEKGEFSPFVVRYIDRKYRSVETELYYNDKDEGIIRVPAGFVTDFASIGALKTPKLYALYSLLVGYGDIAATIHDYLYYRGFREIRDGVWWSVDRKTADRIFYNALRAEGIARWRAWMFYAGVRVGGWYAWRKHRNSPQEQLF